MSILVEYCRFFHAGFMTKKRIGYFKSNKTSNSMTKETTTFLMSVAASLAELIQRWDHLVSPGNVNIGGILPLLPCQFHENQQNLEFDDQGDNNIPSGGCSKLVYTITEMGQLGFSKKWQYWWNAGHSSMPF
jgi:hypothetical protein